METQVEILTGKHPNRTGLLRNILTWSENSWIGDRQKGLYRRLSFGFTTIMDPDGKVGFSEPLAAQP